MAVASVGQRSDTVGFIMPRMSLEMAGLIALLVGAWGGIVPYVGPVFGFSADGTGSWHWNLAHSLLFLVPGAAAVVAAMVIMTAAVTVVARPALLAVAGWLVANCGAWLVVGPLAWPVLQESSFYGGASALTEFEYWIGYSLGPGGLLLALGAFVVGRDYFTRYRAAAHVA